MTITEEDFGGFESGGTEELATVAGMVALTTPAPWTAKETYIGESKGTGSGAVYPRTKASAPGTDWITVGVFFRFDRLDPAIARNILDASDSTAQGHPGVYHWRLELQTNGDVKLFDKNNALKTTLTAPFTANTWHLLEVKFKRASATLTLWIDSVQKYSASGAWDSGTDSMALRFGAWIGLDPAPGPPQTKVYVGSWYRRHDDGAAIDTNDTRLGNYAVLGPYNWSHSGTTADFGSALNAGTWDNLKEVPKNDANTGTYTENLKSVRQGGVTTDSGAKTGPKDDADVDGTMIASYWFWRAKKSSKFALQALIGKYGAHAIPSTDGTTTTGAKSLTTSFQNFTQFLPASDANHPTTIEWFQIGMKQTSFGSGSGDLIMGEMWVFLLHQEPPAVEQPAVFFGANF